MDTNVVRSLAEKRIAEAESYETAIQKALRSRSLIIAPSIEVLDELFRSPDLDHHSRMKNAQFYDSIVDWRQALKPSNKIIEDDIHSYLRCGRPAIPYQGISEDSQFIKSIRRGEDVFSASEFARICRDTRRQNARLSATLERSLERNVSEESKCELIKAPELTWRRWWDHDGVAESIARSFAKDPQGFRGRCLLSLPSLRAVVGYILRMLHQRVATGRKIKPTDHHDSRIAIQAGAVGRVVTQDKILGAYIHSIPQLSVQVWMLPDFVAKL